jgi:hypothetical protein
MMEQLSDEALMSAVMSGKSTTLAMLVERYHSPLLGYTYRLVGGDRPLAEDIVQETFLHILQKSGYQLVAHSSPGSMPLLPTWYATISSRLQSAAWPARTAKKNLRGRNMPQQVIQNWLCQTWSRDMRLPLR